MRGRVETGRSRRYIREQSRYVSVGYELTSDGGEFNALPNEIGLTHRLDGVGLSFLIARSSRKSVAACRRRPVPPQQLCFVRDLDDRQPPSKTLQYPHPLIRLQQ